jgi:hypothetical protein
MDFTPQKIDHHANEKDDVKPRCEHSPWVLAMTMLDT